MSAFAPISLDDAASTAVVFNPQTINPAGVAILAETAAATFEERRSVSMLVRPPKVGGSVARITLKVATPIVDGSSPPLKVGENFCNIEFVISKRASASQKADLLAFAAGFLADSSVAAAVNDFESIY